MQESSGSQFFRITSKIQSGPDVFEKSRFVMIFESFSNIMQFQISSRKARMKSKTLVHLHILHVLLITRMVWGLQLYWKKRLWHKCFPVNFAKFLRKPFLQNTSGRLLLWLIVWQMQACITGLTGILEMCSISCFLVYNGINSVHMNEPYYKKHSYNNHGTTFNNKRAYKTK